jgi:hypothetical protein
LPTTPPAASIAQQGYAATHQYGQRTCEPCCIAGPIEAAKQRNAQQHAVDGNADRLLLERPGGAYTGQHHHNQADETVFADGIGNSQECTRQERQLLLGALEYRDHLRHNPVEHTDDDEQRNTEHHSRIDEGQCHLGRQGLARFDIVGQALHDTSGLARLFAGAHDGAIKLGEHAWVSRKRDREWRTSQHFATNAGKYVTGAQVLGLLDQHGKRAFDGEAGFEQGGKLARDQRKFGGRHAGTPALLAVGAALGQFVEFGYPQPLLAQTGTRTARVVGLDHALHGLAAGVERLIAVSRHP